MITDRSYVEIHLDRLRDNLRELKRYLRCGQEFMQIVKADAYGHGAYEVALVAISEGAVYLGVANCEEGKLLRLQGIKHPILILSPILENEIEEIILHDLSVSVSSVQMLKRLHEVCLNTNKRLTIHIKIDTGMKRSGALPHEFNTILENLVETSSIYVEGVFSHYAASEADDDLSNEQAKKLHNLIADHASQFRYIHIANSSAIFKHNPQYCNLLRFGILSYGVYTNQKQRMLLNLKPVMTFKSTLSQIKQYCAGEGIGYNHTFKSTKNGFYGILPVGYADGYDFLLSNQAQVELQNTLCPVIGRISMDMTSIDLGVSPDSQVGDQAILLGGETDATRAETLSKLYSGSAYEILCQIGRRAKRYYIDKGSLVSTAPLSRREFVSSDFSNSKLNKIIESAISHRLQNDEIGELIYKEILRSFFYHKDLDISYRRNFVHNIAFTTKSSDGDYYHTRTDLTFDKTLQSNYFIVACATSDKHLSKYFMRKDVEYRWLMDDKIRLDENSFKIASAKINDLELVTEVIHKDSALEIRCSHPELASLVGKECKFYLETETFYPSNSHQLSVFITELTRGAKISFSYPKEMGHVEAVRLFSGQNRDPKLTQNGSSVSLETGSEEWIFPLSGIVFAY